MSIPKIIHYCWFGRNPMPISAIRCIDSWKKFCPDYQIKEWNEDNFDIYTNRYMREAYENQKWAFVSDYARLKIVYQEGGIYLDTDVELLRSLDDLLDYEGFMGFQNEYSVASGLGFGAVAGNPVLKAMLEDYEGIPFLLDHGNFDMTPCPDRNTKCMEKFGLKLDGKRQNVSGIEIFPEEYFCPMNWRTGKIHKTKNTYSIHHFDASWMDKEEQIWTKIRWLVGGFVYRNLRYRIVKPIKALFFKK